MLHRSNLILGHISDDFTQIPSDSSADLPAGSYGLTVEGGENSAEVVISVNWLSFAIKRSAEGIHKA